MKRVKKEIIKNICDSVNHTRFPKEDHLADWARRDNKVTKGDRLDPLSWSNMKSNCLTFWRLMSTIVVVPHF